MKRSDDELPARLRLVGATNLEQRLLDAAGGEQPSRELSERMAQAIGVTLPATFPAGNDASTQPAAPTGSETGAPNATASSSASSSLLPWLAGALGVAAIAGIFVATRLEPAP